MGEPGINLAHFVELGRPLFWQDLEKCVASGPLCLFWTIWKARNEIVFKDKPFLL